MRYTATLAAAVLAAATTLTAPAAAETVGIKYSDLDLSSKAGQAELESRIDRAARAACNMDEVRTGRIATSTAQRQCYKQAKASVHSQVAEKVARENSRG